MDSRIIKIGLGILLILCLANMPYGYYQLVRILAMVGFGILALSAKKEGKEGEMWIYIALCILFQPFIKIALGRELWNMVDIIVAIGLLISLKINKK